MELQQIRLFLAVVQAQSFSRAADLARRTQPTVSMAISSLEKDLGVRLFERFSRKVVLTEAGQALENLVRPLVAEWDRLLPRLHEQLQGRPSGSVQIGGGDVAVLYVLPQILRQYRRLYPDVSVAVKNQTAAETIDSLRTGDLDVAIRAQSVLPPELAFEKLFRTERVLIVSRSDPIAQVERVTMKSLRGKRFILPNEGTRSRNVIESIFAKDRLRFAEAISVGGWEMMKRYAAIDIGVAIVPEVCLSSADRRQLQVIRAGHLFGYDEYGIVLPTRRSTQRAVHELVRLLRERYAHSE